MMPSVMFKRKILCRVLLEKRAGRFAFVFPNATK